VNEDETLLKKQLQEVALSIGLVGDFKKQLDTKDCQFLAFQKAMKLFNLIHKDEVVTIGGIRKEVAKWLEDNENTIYGENRICTYFSGSHYYHELCNQFIEDRSGDHLSVLALANIYNVNIVILTSLIPRLFNITPIQGEAIGTIYLGHYGQHRYVFLKPTESVENTILSTIARNLEFEEDSEIILVLPESQQNEEEIKNDIISKEMKQPKKKSMLTNYELNSTMGVQFDFESYFVPKITYQILNQSKKHWRIDIDLPGFKIRKPKEDEKIKGRWIITGSRKSDEGYIISLTTRKFGEFKVVFDVPEGYNRFYNEEYYKNKKTKYKDGVFSLYFDKTIEKDPNDDFISDSDSEEQQSKIKQRGKEDE